MRRAVLRPWATVPCAAMAYQCHFKATAFPKTPTGVPNFDDPASFRDKSTWYLIKSLAVLKLCSIDTIARNSVPLIRVCEKVLGKGLTYNVLVKHTVYSHFCAGENDLELRNTVKALEAKGIGAVLDYAAEADTEDFVPAPGLAEAPDISMSSLVNKPNLSYKMDEEAFDDNMKLYMMSIMHAALHRPPGSPGVAAVKVTGMCDPKLLARVSAILLSIHQSWCRYFTEEEVPNLEECRVVMGVHRKHELYITCDQLEQGFNRFSPEKAFTDEEMKEVIELFDPTKKGRINYFTYKVVMTNAVTALEPTPVQQKLISRVAHLSDVEKELWSSVIRRLRLIASTAKELDVRALIDAEQTFYQLAIDVLVGKLQNEYNTEKAVVYNTYQCYLTYAEDRISNDLIRAAYLGYHWGGKIVRGAYMVQERETAKQYEYTSPIWPTIEETAKCYEDSAERILRGIENMSDKNYEVFFGTHNRAALERITREVADRPLVQDKVSFGQLYGMRDNLTIPLAKAGFNTFKYVPYGPVKETIHYLARRAIENASILSSGDSDETRMMKKELLRRFGLANK